jgi:hypothetical protein
MLPIGGAYRWVHQGAGWGSEACLRVVASKWGKSPATHGGQGGRRLGGKQMSAREGYAATSG